MQEELVARNKELAEANERIAQLEKTIKDTQKLAELKSPGMAAAQQKAEAAKAKSEPVKPEAKPEPVKTEAAKPAEPVKAEAAPEAKLAPKPAPKPAPAPAAASAKPGTGYALQFFGVSERKAASNFIAASASSLVMLVSPRQNQTTHVFH